MLELAAIYRAMNLYIHHAHNMVNGEDFFQDHEFFGQLYEKADGFYDDIIEREIGLGHKMIPLINIILNANRIIISQGSDYFKSALFFCEEAIMKIEELSKNDKLSIGTQNLLAGQADVLEVFIYKIKQRIV
jgi:DNA-binding ferritin-like protein